MKIDCCVVLDLLPLYVDDMVSAQTAELIKEHLEECDKCREELEQLSCDSFEVSEAGGEKGNEAELLKKFARKLNLRLQSMSYALIILFVFLGLFITEGSDMMYNSLIMPVVGVFGYCSFRLKAIYKLPVILFIIEGFALLFGLVETDVTSLLTIWSAIYLIFIYLGVAIAALFHYAFKKK